MVLHVAGAFDVVGFGAAALEFVEQLAIGLAHHIDQHVEAAAMGHAQHDLADPQLTAALDDLFQRGNGGFGAVQTETLGADEAVGGELLEAFGLDQLVEDSLLAFRRELDRFILDALLQPAFLLGIIDVHELIADTAAIGAAQLVQQLARTGALETQNAVHENGLVHRRAVKTVMLGVQGGLRRARRDAQRIEVGFQMTDHAIGTDHLDGVDGMFGGVGALGRSCLMEGSAAGDCGFALVLAGPALGSRGIRTAQGGGQVVDGCDGLAVTLPGGAAAQLGGGQALFTQLGEIAAPAFVHRSGVGEVLGVKPFQEGRVGAAQKRGGVHDFVRCAMKAIGPRLLCHFRYLRVSLLGLNPILGRRWRRSLPGLGGNAFFPPIQR